MRDRGRRLAMRDAALTMEDADRPVAPRIGRHRAIRRRDDRVVHRAVRHGRGAVDRPALLVGAAGEVHADLVARDGHHRMQAHDLPADAILVQAILEFISSVGHGADGRAHRRLAHVEDAPARLKNARRPIARSQPPDRRRADIQARQLALQVAQHQRGLAHILPDHRPDGLIEHALVDQLQRRDAEPFLEHLRRRRRIAAWRHAAHVDVVAQRTDIGDANAIDEDRLEYEHVVEVLRTAIRVVGRDNIILAPTTSIDKAVQQRAQRRTHRVQVLRNTRRLRDIVALRIEHRGRVV